VVADDHPVVLRGIVEVLESSHAIEVVAACNDGLAAREAILKHQPEVAVLDLSMPRAGGLETLAALKHHTCSTRVVFLTGAISEREVTRALALGAKAILLKETAPEELLLCVRSVAEGKTWLSPGLPVETAAEDSTNVTGSLCQQILTAREREVILLVAEGLSNKAVAKQLHLSEGTVKIHLHNIYRKLSLANRTALTLFALTHASELHAGRTASAALDQAVRRQDPAPLTPHARSVRR
jgi:DNA-binding NarL/FixJ family response regulator